MKKIEDYLHLYLGCAVSVTDTDGQTFTYEFGDCPRQNRVRYYRQRWASVFYLDNHDEYYQKIQPIIVHYLT